MKMIPQKRQALNLSVNGHVYELGLTLVRHVVIAYYVGPYVVREALQLLSNRILFAS